jgi:ribosomal protein S18 acetylase RimI-like enzyme
MKGPSDQAKLLLFALLRSTATALATTGEKSVAASARMMLPTMNIQLRLATRNDVPGLQRCNLACLPENYNAEFYGSHLKQWPELALVAEHVPSSHSNKNQNIQPQQHSFRRPFQPSPEPKIVAYVLGKVETRPVVFDYHNPDHEFSSSARSSETIGHVTSLAVLQEYRRQGLAQALMTQLHFHLEHYAHCGNLVTACGLHVRKSNVAACRLYQQDGYEIAQMIPSYYQDGEDAYFMKKTVPLLNPTASYQQQQQAKSSRKRDFRMSKCWKHGPDELILPRRHELPVEEEEDAEEQSTASSSSSSSSPELLTGTM